MARRPARDRMAAPTPAVAITQVAASASRKKSCPTSGIQVRVTAGIKTSSRPIRTYAVERYGVTTTACPSAILLVKYELPTDFAAAT